MKNTKEVVGGGTALHWYGTQGTAQEAWKQIH